MSILALSCCLLMFPLIDLLPCDSFDVLMMPCMIISYGFIIYLGEGWVEIVGDGKKWHGLKCIAYYPSWTYENFSLPPPLA